MCLMCMFVALMINMNITAAVKFGGGTRWMEWREGRGPTPESHPSYNQATATHIMYRCSKSTLSASQPVLALGECVGLFLQRGIDAVPRSKLLW